MLVMPAAKPKKDELPVFWFPHASEGYVIGEVLQQDDSGNMHVRLQAEGESSKVCA